MGQGLEGPEGKNGLHLVSCPRVRLPLHNISQRRVSVALKRPGPIVTRLLTNYHSGTDRRIFKKSDCHFLWQPNTAVRCRIAGQIAGVHANTPVDSKEVRHRRATKHCAGRSRILRCVDILHHDLSASIDVISVNARNVGQIFLTDMELTRGRVVTFPAGRDDRNTDDSISPVKISPLLVESYNDS